jgi:hypothetical protein
MCAGGFEQVHDWTAGRRNLRITSDAPAPDATEIKAVSRIEQPQLPLLLDLRKLRAGLRNRCTASRYRGFESLLLR